MPVTGAASLLSVAATLVISLAARNVLVGLFSGVIVAAWIIGDEGALTNGVIAAAGFMIAVVTPLAWSAALAAALQCFVLLAMRRRREDWMHQYHAATPSSGASLPLDPEEKPCCCSQPR